MSKSNMSSIPGVGAMTDTLEFVKNMWGGMKIPGMVMPTLSVDDINKQITDLKAVESWLTLNMNMLRGTIQALEVQSATIATLQSMSAAMNSMGQANATEDKSEFESPFSASPSTAAKSSVSGSGEQSQPQPNDPAGLVAPFANPAVWWNMLQDQFNQAVSTAVTPEPEPPEAKTTTPRKRKPSSKS